LVSPARDQTSSTYKYGQWLVLSHGGLDFLHFVFLPPAVGLV
jgi:hypothetical protein